MITSVNLLHVQYYEYDYSHGEYDYKLAAEVQYCIQYYFEKRGEGTRNMSAQKDAVQAKGTSYLHMYAV